MSPTELKSRIQILFMVIFMFPASIFAQQDIKTETLLQDSVTAEKPGSKHNIYANAGFGYNMVYMGTSLSQDKPYFSGGLIYGFNNEIFLSASTFHLNVYDEFLAFSTFSLNYSHTFNSWFDIALSASRYQVNNALSDTLFASFFYGDLTLGFDWKILYTKISAGGLFSESSSAYFQLRNSRYFQTPEFFKGKAYFSFDPYVNLLFGTLTETSEGTTIVSPPFHGGKSGSGSSSTTTSRFSLMEVDLGIPVSFNIGRFTLEAEPGYIIPLYTGTGTNNFIFTVGCLFRIL